MTETPLLSSASVDHTAAETSTCKIHIWMGVKRLLGALGILAAAVVRRISSDDISRFF